MVLFQRMIPKNHPNRPGVALEEFKAIVIHYTANDSPKADDKMNADWFARAFKVGTDGKYQETDGSPFGFGSAHVIFDNDSGVQCLPFEEKAYGCGDRPLPYEERWKGQRPLARLAFGNRQNSKTVNVEVCNNKDFTAALNLAKEWCIAYLNETGKKVNVQASLEPYPHATQLSAGEVYLLRHYDITGKLCPAPLVGEGKAREQWEKFVMDVAHGS